VADDPGADLTSRWRSVVSDQCLTSSGSGICSDCEPSSSTSRWHGFSVGHDFYTELSCTPISTCLRLHHAPQSLRRLPSRSRPLTPFACRCVEAMPAFQRVAQKSGSAGLIIKFWPNRCPNRAKRRLCGSVVSRSHAARPTSANPRPASSKANLPVPNRPIKLTTSRWSMRLNAEVTMIQLRSGDDSAEAIASLRG
jgi:hypothetical protein